MYEYRLTWEHVSAITHPEYLYDDGLKVIPEEHWSTCIVESSATGKGTRSKESLEEQYQGLLKLVEDGELIRNVKMQRAVVRPLVWEPYTP